MKTKITKEIKTGILSADLVDEFSEYTNKVLKETKLPQKDILRFQMSVDSAMYIWLKKLGEGAECTFEMTRRFGRMRIAVTCKGEQCNPQESSGEEYGSLDNSSLLQSLGLSIGYKYENGINQIIFMPNPGFVQQLLPIVLAFVLGIGIAYIFKSVDPAAASAFNTQIVDPVFTSLMGLLRAVASPLIFLAVLSGIYGIGDIAMLGTIGKKLIGRFIMMTFITLAISLVIILPASGATFGDYSGGGAIGEILSMVLQFIPSDIVSPFLNGNMLQIITISVACGLITLILGESVTELTRVADQLYSVVQLLMEKIGRLVPLFIFISMLSLVLSDSDISIMDIIKPVLVIIASLVIMALLVYPLLIKKKYGIKVSKLMKKLLPTFLIALTTASSAAAFSTNVETCEKELGISEKVTRFGVPLGQIVYMPFAAVEYFSISVFMAASWDVSISPMWLMVVILVSGILSIATPPIPGGSIPIFTVLFVQLGIPVAALPVALGIDMLVDYIVTAGDIMCLQEDLVISSGRLNLLDRDKLTLDK